MAITQIGTHYTEDLKEIFVQTLADGEAKFSIKQKDEHGYYGRVERVTQAEMMERFGELKHISEFHQ